MKPQCKQILDILADGRWHSGRELHDAYINDVRKRISEINAEFPGRIEKQKVKGSSLLMRRDTHAVEIRKDKVMAEIRRVRDELYVNPTAVVYIDGMQFTSSKVAFYGDEDIFNRLEARRS